jgi:hypothetical protein
MGARRGNFFVATEVLISADTLGDETAIRAWLAQHDIHVAPPCRSTASTPKGSTEGDRLMTGPDGAPGHLGETGTTDDHRTS